MQTYFGRNDLWGTASERALTVGWAGARFVETDTGNCYHWISDSWLAIPTGSGGAHAGTHVTGGNDTIASAVAGGSAGLMTGADKTKLDGVASGAVADHTAIANRGTTTHETIDNFIGSKHQASGIASLDTATAVVEAVQRLLSGTGAVTTTEGYLRWHSTGKRLDAYDAVRERSLTDRGWMPYAFPISFAPNAAFTTALALAANGGSVAIPIWLDGHMLLQSVSVRNTDTGTARTWGWDLYEQYQNSGSAGENTLTRVAACTANETYTPSAASTRTLAVGSAPVYLGPGLYWLVIQSRHATSTFGLGSTAASAAFALSTAQTKTTANPNGATLDFVAATWAKVTAMYAVRLNGRVFGQTTSF